MTPADERSGEWINASPADLLNSAFGKDGSCVACLNGTDTAIGVRGPAEAIVAALVVFTGDSEEVATSTLGWREDSVPSGELLRYFRLCVDCATFEPGSTTDKRSMPFPVGLVPVNVPVIEIGAA